MQGARMKRIEGTAGRKSVTLTSVAIKTKSENQSAMHKWQGTRCVQTSTGTVTSTLVQRAPNRDAHRGRGRAREREKVGEREREKEQIV